MFCFGDHVLLVMQVLLGLEKANAELQRTQEGNRFEGELAVTQGADSTSHIAVVDAGGGKRPTTRLNGYCCCGGEEVDTITW